MLYTSSVRAEGCMLCMFVLHANANSEGTNISAGYRYPAFFVSVDSIIRVNPLFRQNLQAVGRVGTHVVWFFLFSLYSTKGCFTPAGIPTFCYFIFSFQLDSCSSPSFVFFKTLPNAETHRFNRTNVSNCDD